MQILIAAKPPVDMRINLTATFFGGQNVWFAGNWPIAKDDSTPHRKVHPTQ